MYATLKQWLCCFWPHKKPWTPWRIWLGREPYLVPGEEEGLEQIGWRPVIFWVRPHLILRLDLTERSGLPKIFLN